MLNKYLPEGSGSEIDTGVNIQTDYLLLNKINNNLGFGKFHSQAVGSAVVCSSLLPSLSLDSGSRGCFVDTYRTWSQEFSQLNVWISGSRHEAGDRL